MEGNRIAPVDGETYYTLAGELNKLNIKLDRIQAKNDCMLKALQILLSGNDVNSLFKEEIEQEKANRLEEMLSKNTNHIPFID